MPLSEPDTRAKLIDPAIHAKGRSKELIRRETTLGGNACPTVRGRAAQRGLLSLATGASKIFIQAKVEAALIGRGARLPLGRSILALCQA